MHLSQGPTTPYKYMTDDSLEHSTYRGHVPECRSSDLFNYIFHIPTIQKDLSREKFYRSVGSFRDSETTLNCFTKSEYSCDKVPIFSNICIIILI